MFQYQNGKLCAEGISFEIPNNFYINTSPCIEGDNFIELWSNDKDYMIIIAIEEHCLGTKQELEQAVSGDSGDYAMDDIKETAINGLNGHFLFYKSLTGERYQVRLNIPHKKNCEFTLYIGSHQGNINEIVESKEIQNVIKNILYITNGIA